MKEFVSGQRGVVQNKGVVKNAPHVRRGPGTNSFTQLAPNSATRKLWPLGIYRVAGESMLPTYRSGDTLLGWRWFRPRVGHVAIAYRDGQPLIKRIVRVDAERVWLEGDNPAASTDSRHFGPLNQSQVVAYIIARLG